MPIRLNDLDLDSGPELAEDIFALDLGASNDVGIPELDGETESI